MLGFQLSLVEKLQQGGSEEGDNFRKIGRDEKQNEFQAKYAENLNSNYEKKKRLNQSKPGDGVHALEKSKGVDELELLASPALGADWSNDAGHMSDRQFLECLDSDATSTTTQFADATLASPFAAPYIGATAMGGKEDSVVPDGKLEYMMALGLRPKGMEDQGRLRERPKASKRKQPVVDYSLTSSRHNSSNNYQDRVEEPKGKKKKTSRKEGEKGRDLEFSAAPADLFSLNNERRAIMIGDIGELSDHEDLCTVCRTPGELLCCETCELVYHLKCLKPQLKKVPEGAWLCPECTRTKSWQTFSPHAVTRDFLLFNNYQTKEQKIIENSNSYLSKENEKLKEEIENLKKKLIPLQSRLTSTQNRNSKASNHLLSLQSVLRWILKLADK